MQLHPERAYLRLEQFLDLERSWTEADGDDELGHRIAATMSLMLKAERVAISVSGPDRQLHELASTGSPSADEEAGPAGLAMKTGRPELRRRGETTLAAFPFDAGASRVGVLALRARSGSIGAKEISFLRFLAALAGTYFASRQPPLSPVGTTDRYLAMAAHDIRSPLALVEARLALLAEHESEAGRDQTARELGKAQRRLAAVSRSVTALMDIDRLGDGRLSPKTGTVELGRLFQELREERLEDPAGRLDWPTWSQQPAVLSDGALLRAALGELIHNALSHGKGPVTVACHERDREVSIEVSDHGPPLNDAQVAVLVAGGPPQRAQTTVGFGLRAVAAYAHALGVRVVCSLRPGGGNIVVLGPFQSVQSSR